MGEVAGALTTHRIAVWHVDLARGTDALLALGYSDREAAAALKALPAEVGVSEGIKLALKALSR